MVYGSGKISVLAVSNGATLFSTASGLPSGPFPVWSTNERFLAFFTTAAVAPNDTNSASDVYLADLISGSVTLVSASTTNPGAGNAASDSPGISVDGRFVVFRSFATDLAPGIINPPNVFVFTGSPAATRS